MGLGAQDAAAFYAGARGGVVTALVRDLLASLWPDLRNLSLLGLGHASPYLGLWRGDAAARLDFRLGAGAAATDRGDEAGRPPLLAAIDDRQLPLRDLSQDRILLVHGLEVATDARRLLRECWRVLADDGRLIVVAPNRTGPWAHAEATPFGHGQPYSTGQLRRLLEAGMFSPHRSAACVFAPPVGPVPGLALARRFEGVGRRLAPGVAGLLLVEAAKDRYAAIPGTAARVEPQARARALAASVRA